jgi:transposase
LNPQQEAKARDKAKAIKLWGQGLSASAIAERLGRRRDLITEWVTEAGLREKGEGPRYRYDGEGGVAATGKGGQLRGIRN